MSLGPPSGDAPTLHRPESTAPAIGTGRYARTIGKRFRAEPDRVIDSERMTRTWFVEARDATQQSTVNHWGELMVDRA
jgi:hypothetical protein